MSTSWWMAASKHVCALFSEMSKAARLLFSLYVNDVDCLAENVQGAVTGTSDMRVTHMLHSCLTSNMPDQLQLMLDRLHAYAQRKELVINAAKSEIVHFNPRGDNLPVFTLGRVCLAYADSFRYLGMLFTKKRKTRTT
eukprot:173924-Pelagomonas_calceolata.AAC.1